MPSQIPAARDAASNLARSNVGARGGWTEPAVQRLTDLWIYSDLSAADIARRLGVTRNAVLGKVHRLGLSNRRPVPKARQPRPVLPPRAPQRRRSSTPRPASTPRPPQGRSSAVDPGVDLGPGLVARLEDLPRHSCHWPLGDPYAADFRFCGRHARLAPYCDAHRRVAFRPAARIRPRRG